jgi:hypothetical protein
MKDVKKKKKKAFETDEIWEIVGSLTGVLGYLEKKGVRDFDWEEGHLMVLF